MCRIFSAATTVILLTAIFIVSPVTAAEGGFSNTEFQFLMNIGPLNLEGADDAGRTFTMTFDHFSTWSHGSNYFFLDVQSGPDYDFYKEDFSLYFEYAPAFSIYKIFGITTGEGSPIRDVSLTPQINLGRGVGYEVNRVWLEGVIVAWNIPGFAVFDTAFLARQEKDYKPSWQITLVWNVPFKLGPTSWQFRGFIDLWQRFKDTGFSEDAVVLLTQPQLLMDFGFAGLKGLLFGVEVQLSHAFPSDGAYAGEDSSWDVRISPMLSFKF